MSLSHASLFPINAGALRSASLRGQEVAAVGYYFFGYWFSHWRACYPAGARASRAATRAVSTAPVGDAAADFGVWPEERPQHKEYTMTTYRAYRDYRHDWRFSRFTAALAPPERTLD